MADYWFTGKAQKDLSDIVEYTRNEWGSAQILAYINSIEGACQMLAENPGIGKDVREVAPDLMSYPIKSHVIYYKRQQKDISVIRILHMRMLPDIYY